MRDQRQRLSEASLGRMLQHIESGQSWGFISAARHEQSPRERNRSTQSLASDIRSLGYGFNKVEGGWEEKNMDTGEKVLVTEPSFFIPEITRPELMKLASKYNQEAVVYGEPDPEVRSASLHRRSAGPQILLIEPPNKVIEMLGPNNRRSFNPHDISTAFTKVKGKTFTLGESVAIPLNKKAAELRVGDKSNDSDLKNMILNFVKKKGRSE